MDEEHIDPRKLMLPGHRSLIALLQNASKEIEISGKISQELKERIFALDS